MCTKESASFSRTGIVTRQHLGQREERGVVGHEAGGEEQGSVLPVEIGQLVLQVHVELTRPRYIPSPSSSRTVLP